MRNKSIHFFLLVGSDFLEVDLQAPDKKHMIIVAMGEHLLWKLLWKRDYSKEKIHYIYEEMQKLQRRWTMRYFKECAFEIFKV